MMADAKILEHQNASQSVNFTRAQSVRGADKTDTGRDPAQTLQMILLSVRWLENQALSATYLSVRAFAPFLLSKKQTISATGTHVSYVPSKRTSHLVGIVTSLSVVTANDKDTRTSSTACA